MEIEEALAYFEMWFVQPVEKLKELPNGAGGFVAFMVGLALYERLISAKLKFKNLSSNEETFKKAMAEDLRLSDKDRSIFWDMLRNGLLHQGMPKIGRTGCFFHHSFSEYPEFTQINGKPVICIDPWKFTDRVIKEFLVNPSLINSSESFPLAYISPIPFNK